MELGARYLGMDLASSAPAHCRGVLVAIVQILTRLTLDKLCLKTPGY
ncbi:hypothetical protein [Chroococcidiopsis sp. SAG 2025]|nr:hypothetical protein [Chroococcidiopsis sp. SAG 2025]